MASLPPAWTADYDGQRWFFTYGPTGQSQFQFPRPGDEFPDLLPTCAFGLGAGDAVPPGVELLPDQRLERERQVRRGHDAGGGRTGDVMVDEQGGVRGRGRGRGRPAREESGDGVGPVCFENFAAVKSRGRHGLGGDREGGTRTVEQSGFREGDGVLMPTNVGIAEASGESSDERVSIPLAIKEDYCRADASSSQGRARSAANISIMSEPVLAVVETGPAARVGCEQQQQPPLSPELPRSDARAIKSAHSPPWAISVGVIPELYSESTALCEDEINTPPVELPCDEGGRNGRSVVPNTVLQNIHELPAHERPGTSLVKDERPARFQSRYVAGSYTDTPQDGATRAPAAKRCSHDRGGLPSQASRMQCYAVGSGLPEKPDSAMGQKQPPTETDQPAQEAGAEKRDLTHFPSILRPGPRRSDQRRPPAPMTAAPLTDTPHKDRDALPRQPEEYRYEDRARGGAVPHVQRARMPAMPPPYHANEPQQARRRKAGSPPGVGQLCDTHPAHARGSASLRDLCVAGTGILRWFSPGGGRATRRRRSGLCDEPGGGGVVELACG